MKTFLLFLAASLSAAAVVNARVVYAEEFVPPARFLAEPAQKMFGEGEEFSVQILLDSNEPVTSWQAMFPYDSSILKVGKISGNKEFFPYWFEENDMGGVIQLMASAPVPGFQGRGLLATVSFEALKSGETDFSFNPSSLALSANDVNLLEKSAKEPNPAGHPDYFPNNPWNKVIIVVAGILLLLLGALAVFFVSRKRFRNS